MSKTKVFLIGVEGERNKQDNKWGIQEHGGHAWLGILAEEFGELAKAINENKMIEVEEELVQVAAVACAMWEQLMSSKFMDLNPQFGTFGKDSNV